MMGREDARNM